MARRRERAKDAVAPECRNARTPGREDKERTRSESEIAARI